MPQHRAIHLVQGLATLFLLGGVGACGRSAERAAAQSGDHFGAGVQVIRNSERGAWSSRDAWRLVEERRIGSPDGDGPDTFGKIVDLALDPLGRVWVADGQASQIRVFEPGGRHVRSIGSKGAGPDEFGQIAGMDWGPGGNLWVLDSGNSRYAVFDTAGKLVKTLPRQAGVSMVPWPGGFDQRGQLYDIVPIPQKLGEVAYAVVRYDASLEPEDTFRIPPFEGKSFELVTNGGRNRNLVNVPFTGSQIWRVAPDGNVWTAVTDRYSLYQQRFGGDTTRVVQRAFTPVPISSDEMERMIENYRWFTDQGGRLDRSQIPSVKPAFDTFFFSTDGTLWVVPNVAHGQGTAFDVFERGGRYLGRISTNAALAATPTPAVNGDRLAAVTEDEDGVQSIVIMRLQRGHTTR